MLLLAYHYSQDDLLNDFNAELSLKLGSDGFCLKLDWARASN